MAFAAEHTNDRIDCRRGERQAQSFRQSPTKRSNNDREEEEVIEDAVFAQCESYEWQVPQQIKPWDEFVCNNWISPDRQVVDQ